MQLIIQGQTVEGAEDSEEDEDESKKRQLDLSHLQLIRSVIERSVYTVNKVALFRKLYLLTSPNWLRNGS